ncbi:MAG TPA: 4Fe-4S binding protein [Clostridiaceae bacterium]|nr:4Fe-4S binding protein [Clostridiaceae bacterium]
MEYVQLGKTGLRVSKLCFGGLVIGPLQVNLTIDEGANVIARALELGVNFIDTAELYDTYPHIREAIRKTNKKPIVASRCYAYTREGAAQSLEKARKELDMDVIDIFGLHEQESRLTLRGHREALEYFVNAKEKGIIKAVSVSTHNIEVVEACAEMPEVDVIHPLVNVAGIGIGDGTIEEMLNAVKKAYDAGKGIYSMKPFGGGNLINRFEECVNFLFSIPYIHSIAIGMQSVEEVEINEEIFEKRYVPEELKTRIKNIKKKLHIDYWCEGCEKCIERCKQKALEIVDGKAKVNYDKCILCGYCASACPQFAIKMQ